MIDANRYVGIPFVPRGRARAGCDCWGLVWLVHRDHGIGVPSYAEHYIAPLNRRHIAALIAREQAAWTRVDPPRPLDVVLLRAHGAVWHAGIVVEPGLMLHVLKGIDACLERYDGLQWRARVAGFYRHDR